MLATCIRSAFSRTSSSYVSDSFEYVILTCVTSSASSRSSSYVSAFSEYSILTCVTSSLVKEQQQPAAKSLPSSS